MEIERKFLIRTLPSDLESYDHAVLEQAYLSRTPVVRVRKENDTYTLTYKGSGMMAREEYNLPLTKESYEHLLSKHDGRVITKTRYRIPYTKYTIELDIFSGDMDGLIMAEVEFPTVEEAENFKLPDWFKEDVTMDKRFHNVNMAYSE